MFSKIPTRRKEALINSTFDSPTTLREHRHHFQSNHIKLKGTAWNQISQILPTH
jgi:hypothetical protein